MINSGYYGSSINEDDLGPEQRDAQGDPLDKNKIYKRSSVYAVDDTETIKENMERIANEEGRLLRDEGPISEE